MHGKPSSNNGIVSCTCDGIKASGTYEVEGLLLVLTTRFGVKRVPLGLSEPSKLATTLMKNICTKATTRRPVTTSGVADVS